MQYTSGKSKTTLAYDRILPSGRFIFPANGGGSSCSVLLTGKIANGYFPDNPKFYMNKVDMFHLDLIVNYVF